MSTGEAVTAREAGNGASADGSTLLSLRGVGKSFGPVRALTNIKLDVPVRQVPGANLKVAFVTDPWGTYIELTEGLAPPAK